MICPHCSQWNPARSNACVFCRSPIGAAAGASAAARARRGGPDSPIKLLPISDPPKLGGSPADLARWLRVTSAVVTGGIVVLWILLHSLRLSCL